MVFRRFGPGFRFGTKPETEIRKLEKEIILEKKNNRH